MGGRRACLTNRPCHGIRLVWKVACKITPRQATARDTRHRSRHRAVGSANELWSAIIGVVGRLRSIRPSGSSACLGLVGSTLEKRRDSSPIGLHHATPEWIMQSARGIAGIILERNQLVRKRTDEPVLVSHPTVRPIRAIIFKTGRHVAHGVHERDQCRQPGAQFSIALALRFVPDARARMHFHTSEVVLVAL